MKRDGICRTGLVAAVLCFVLLLTGCTEGIRVASPKGYSQLCERYVGKDSREIIDAWGYPGRTYEEKDGGKVLVYVETRDEYALNPLAHMALLVYPPEVEPRMTSADGRVVGAPVPSMDYCITYVYVNKDKKIVKTLWKGDCRSLERQQGD